MNPLKKLPTYRFFRHFPPQWHMAEMTGLRLLPGRNLRIELSADQAVALEFAELLSEHFRRDRSEEAAKLGKAPQLRIEVIEDKHFPFAADQHEGALGRTSGFCSGIHAIQWYILYTEYTTG
jgi:hypothetical protein